MPQPEPITDPAIVALVASILAASRRGESRGTTPDPTPITIVPVVATSKNSVDATR